MRAVRDFGRGVALYWGGWRAWREHPGPMWLGLLPAAITATSFAFVFVALGWKGSDVATWLASAMGAEGAWRGFLAFMIAIAMVAGALLLAIYAFVTVASVIGQPFFEHISHQVDDALGPVPEGPGWPWWRNALRGVAEALRLGVVTVPLSIAIALLGFIPAVGTALAWVLGALCGGWFVALEFTAIPCERRGITLTGRRRAMGSRRALVVGFGAMAYVMSAVPVVAVLMMPVAVAGGTRLARIVLDGEPPVASA